MQGYKETGNSRKILHGAEKHDTFCRNKFFKIFYILDTVQNLYNEIENLIDIPFEATCQPIQAKDFHYKQDLSEPNNDYTFDRPILIESDSDDIEEEYVLISFALNNFPITPFF